MHAEFWLEKVLKIFTCAEKVFPTYIVYTYTQQANVKDIIKNKNEQ